MSDVVSLPIWVCLIKVILKSNKKIITLSTLLK